MAISNRERVHELLRELLSLTESVPEAAERRGITQQTVRMYASYGIGDVETVNSGSRVIISPDEAFRGGEQK